MFRSSGLMRSYIALLYISGLIVIAGVIYLYGIAASYIGFVVVTGLREWENDMINGFVLMSCFVLVLRLASTLREMGK